MNFQVLVAEDAELDSRIRPEDPQNDLVFVPGFPSTSSMETAKDWPLVWFPILGENKVDQYQKVSESTEISGDAEVCPVVPHPSADPRLGDRLIIEYRLQLFERDKANTSSIMYASESNPFEAYRQLYSAIDRYQRSLEILGGSRAVVTPLASKLITLGAALACFDLRPSSPLENRMLSIPCVAPRRYVVSGGGITTSSAELVSLLLTGIAYQS